MRVRVTLPTFRDDVVALDAARRAEGLGLDGVFVFDHLWPMGAPERPALSAFPVLGALLGATERVCVGPLVARVGLVPDELLVAELVSLATMAPRRVIAGLGTGDRKSAAENLAYGVPFDPADDRRLALGRVAEALLGAGVPVWVGGGSTATTEMAVELGAAVNLWEGQPAALAALRSRCEVTWSALRRSTAILVAVGHHPHTAPLLRGTLGHASSSQQARFSAAPEQRGAARRHGGERPASSATKSRRSRRTGPWRAARAALGGAEERTQGGEARRGRGGRRRRRWSRQHAVEASPDEPRRGDDVCVGSNDRTRATGTRSGHVSVKRSPPDTRTCGSGSPSWTRNAPRDGGRPQGASKSAPGSTNDTISV